MEDASDDPMILGILSSFSLIERVDASGYTKMHPMIHAMVLWIVCKCGKRANKWFVAEREELLDAPDGEIWRGAARLALGYNNFNVLPESPERPNLVCLKLKNNLSLEKIPDGFLRFMPSLIVLDLHSTSVKNVPPGIGNIIGLQFLELYGTKLKSLPREMGKLKKLKYLGLNWTVDLATIPKGLIQSFANLRALRMIVSYSAWKAGSAGDGVDFDELEGLKRLRILDITIGTAAALKKLSQSRRLAPTTVALLIKGGQGLTTIELPSTLGRNMRSLKWLRISHSTELEEVVIGNSRGEAALLPEPENLVREFLRKARIVMRSHFIEHLRGLYIYGCNVMEQLVYYKDGGETATEGAAAAPFPNLKEIALRRLPELKRVSDERRALVFPALESMEVEKCAKLRKLNLVAEKLREIKCERSWRDQLEWEDDATSSASSRCLSRCDFE